MDIKVIGAKENNLANIAIELKDGLTCVTGISGSGKSSLIFSTLYHEANRRFLDIFARGSTSTRLTPAKVQEIKGIGPTIAIEQNLLNKNPRSTLATASGLHPFLRLLYSHLGERKCPKCQNIIQIFSEDEIIVKLNNLSKANLLSVFAPIVGQVNGSHKTLIEYLEKEFGSKAIFINNFQYQSQKLDPKQKHEIDVKIIEFTKETEINEIRETVKIVKSLGAYALKVHCGDSKKYVFSFTRVCYHCGTWLHEIKPLHFHTSCKFCNGQGCKTCNETGLYPEAAVIFWNGYNLPDLLQLSVEKLCELFNKYESPETAIRLFYEIKIRLNALKTVGLGYISLNRSSPTLSRGESQRVRLALILTNRLEDMLCCLDEPTIGLSINDVQNLIPAFRKLPGSVVYIEHDRIAAAQADYIIDLGPGAGINGGKIVFNGNPASLWESNTTTGLYFSMREHVSIPIHRKKPSKFITIEKASLRNLKDIDIQIPLSRFTVITGPSGSGKSTLVEDVLYASLLEKEAVGCKTLKGTPETYIPIIVDQKPIGKNPRSNPATYTNLASIIRDIFSEHTNLKLTSSHFSFNRSEGACQECKGMGAIEVKMRYLPSTWIICASCEGKRFSDEVLEAKINLGISSLSIADFFELSIDEVYEILIENNRINISLQQRNTVNSILSALRDIGLGYVKLGQSSPSLSGGEAQRVKLAKYLGKKNLDNSILLLDEPSTGLHPFDISGLLKVLDRLVRLGATVIVVEHNSDFIRAADWIIDLGPGGGPDGGQLVFAGSPEKLLTIQDSVTAHGLHSEMELQSIREQKKQSEVTICKKIPHISIKNASANNLKNISVDIPKKKITVITGVSGSGKSSLINDVLKAEAERRFLETLSLYERQGISEGPEAPVESINGLGVTVSVEPTRIGRGWYNYRSTVGVITEILYHLANIISNFGEYRCSKCNEISKRIKQYWICDKCKTRILIPQPRFFSTSNYSSTCTKCHGIGTLRKPEPNKLIVDQTRPICDGAMYSPGFFPQGYLCKRYNGGYYFVQAIAKKYGFDPFSTPWNEMSAEAQTVFLFGDPKPLTVTFESRKRGLYTREGEKYPGFYGWIRDWDVGGTYTITEQCLECKGTGFRSKYLEIKLNGFNIHELRNMSFKELEDVLETLELEESHPVYHSLKKIKQKITFLNHVGLGYLHLARLGFTLSAGEAQRIRLAGLISSDLTSLTILIDEPTKGLHPQEVDALINVLAKLRDEGNTIIVIEHDKQVITSADNIIDMGPGPGILGGDIIATGTIKKISETENSLTGQWLSGKRKITTKKLKEKGLNDYFGIKKYRNPRTWMRILGAKENNLKGDPVEIPLGVLVGICGVSGSGKSTLLIDIIGRALAPIKHTTSVAYEPIEPGKYNKIVNAPKKTLVIDQSKHQINSPLAFFNLKKPFLTLYGASDDAIALGLDERQLSRQCSACKGSGRYKFDMGFLPNVYTDCETCQGTGLIPEAWDIKLHDVSLPELFKLTIDEVYHLFKDEEIITRPLKAAKDVGLGYLVLNQAGFSLSGGECQRLKIAKELSKKTNQSLSLYILDEPTVGLHLEDINILLNVLNKLVDAGNTVLIIEHHQGVLAFACDWLIELGPEGGSNGGYIIAKGTPKEVAMMNTPTAPYLREVLEEEI